MAEPQISVLMTVYNGEAFLREALASLLAQTHQNFELIIVDDGSTDETPQILEQMNDPRMVLLRHPENKGQTRSLNAGLQIARGSLIARQDADDVSHVNRLATQRLFMEAHPDVAVLGSDFEVIDSQGRLLERVHIPQSDEGLRKRLRRGNIFCHGSVMMRREAVLSVGGYRDIFPVTQDFDLWLRLSESSRLASCPEYLYKFRFSALSVSRSSRQQQIAYRNLALELSRQRADFGYEDAWPVSVEQAFAATRESRFFEARGNVYLHWLAGEKEEAIRSMEEAKSLAAKVGYGSKEWSSWILGKALRAVEVRGQPELGPDFIVWCLAGVCPHLKEREQKTLLGRFYADLAFRAWEAGNRKTLLRMTLLAWRTDAKWLLNRGMWAVLFPWKEMPSSVGQQGARASQGHG